MRNHNERPAVREWESLDPGSPDIKEYSYRQTAKIWERAATLRKIPGVDNYLVAEQQLRDEGEL